MDINDQRDFAEEAAVQRDYEAEYTAEYTDIRPIRLTIEVNSSTTTPSYPWVKNRRVRVYSEQYPLTNANLPTGWVMHCPCCGAWNLFGTWHDAYHAATIHARIASLVEQLMPGGDPNV